MKAAVIGAPELFTALESEGRSHEDGVPRSPRTDELRRAIEVKRAVVAEDPREGDRRRVLNLGHTLGHALERDPELDLAHGEAVAIGMVFAAELAADLEVAPREGAARLARVLADRGLPIRWPTDRVDPLLERIAADKKRRAGRTWFALPRAPGDVILAPVATDRIARRLTSGSDTWKGGP